MIVIPFGVFNKSGVPPTNIIAPEISREFDSNIVTINLIDAIWKGTLPLTIIHTWIVNGIDGDNSNTYSANLGDVIKAKVIASNKFGSIELFTNELTFSGYGFKDSVGFNYEVTGASFNTLSIDELENKVNINESLTGAYTDQIQIIDELENKVNINESLTGAYTDQIQIIEEQINITETISGTYE